MTQPDFTSLLVEISCTNGVREVLLELCSPLQMHMFSITALVSLPCLLLFNNHTTSVMLLTRFRRHWVSVNKLGHSPFPVSLLW